jgi:hypothetical protein
MAYTPLDTDQNFIQLMHLSPASSEDDAIRCRFTVVLLDDEPQYEALSYVWGDISDTHFVEVEGRSVPIPANVHSGSEAPTTSRSGADSLGRCPLHLSRSIPNQMVQTLEV